MKKPNDATKSVNNSLIRSDSTWNPTNNESTSIKDSTHPIVLGVDGGIAHFGVAAVELWPDHARLVDLWVFRTKKSDRKVGTLAADDNARRADEIGRALLSRPYVKDIRAICYEAQSLPRNASAAAKTALSLGVLIQFACERQLPLRAVSPQGLKKAATGVATASKEEVEDALVRRFTSGTSYESTAALTVAVQGLNTLPRSIHEHAFDALGAIVACLDTDVIRAIRPRA